MKKWLAVLGMITCMAGLTACGPTEEITPLISQEEAIEIGQSSTESLNQIVAQGLAEQYKGQDVIGPAVESWEKALVEMGSYVGIVETTADVDEEEAIINVTVDGTDHDAIVEIVITKEKGISSVTTNVIKTMGEKILNGALNTLIGMGTVFVILILISLIISCFAVIPKIQKSLEDKKKAKTAGNEPAPAAPAAPVVEEAETDDLELIAVIAAAIAASEGQTSTDGFVVRSIRRR